VKTQIVQLEPYDDYISVRDRMGWGQTTRVLLVWPLQASILNRRLDLLLLKRHSEVLGSQLALVTRDREVRYHASQLEIPVYKSIRDAEQSRWLRPRRRQKSHTTDPDSISKENRSISDLAALQAAAHPATPRWLRNPVVRITFFTLGVLSMLAIVAIFVPSAEIYLTPATKRDQATIRVSASPDNKTMELSGAVPAYWLTSIVEGRGVTPSSGETLIPRQSASGRVTFINLTDEDIFVPVGTIVSTQDVPPIRFATREAVTVPTGPEGATVLINALLPGSSGNVAAEKIVAIEGPLGLNLTVINNRNTSGGTDFTAAAPTEADYQLVHEQLVSSLEATAMSELSIYLENGDILLSSAPSVHQTLEETYTPDIDQPADQLELKLRLEFQIPYAAGADLYQLGQAVLDRQIPENFTPRPETLQITQLTQPVSPELGEATWKILAEWQLGAKLNETQAVSLVLGLSPQQASQQLLDQMPIEDSPKIQLTPSWWPRLPILPFRIKIINELTAQPNNQNTALIPVVAEK
jgi:hypothetical protein